MGPRAGLDGCGNSRPKRDRLAAYKCREYLFIEVDTNESDILTCQYLYPPPQQKKIFLLLICAESAQGPKFNRKD